jgi:hypothetical protein
LSATIDVSANEGDNMLKREKRIAPREILTMTAMLVKRRGNERPYFSVTGEIRDTRLRRGGGIVAAGCLHNEIVKAWPDMQPIIALHLSDDHGMPMHALENGLYFLGLTAYPDAKSLETFARGWRIDLDEATRILAYVEEAGGSRAALNDCLLKQTDRWQHEADEARALLGEVVNA